MAITKLKDVRGSFLDVYVARPFKAGDVSKYKGSFLIKKGSETDKQVRAAIEVAAKEKFGDKYQSILKDIAGNPNKFCYQDGDKKDYEGYAGHMVLTASNKARPLVIDRDKSVLTQSDGKPYSGCYLNANVELFGYDNSGKGIAASLAGVQFLRDGEAFSGGTPANPEDFDSEEAAEGTSEAAGSSW